MNEARGVHSPNKNTHATQNSSLAEKAAASIPQGETTRGETADSKHTEETEDSKELEGTGEEFRVVRRRGKPKFQTPEIKKSMLVDNLYGILEEPVVETDAWTKEIPIDNSMPGPSNPQGGIEIPSKPHLGPSARRSEVSSLSKPLGERGNQLQKDNTVFMREVISTSGFHEQPVPIRRIPLTWLQLGPSSSDDIHPWIGRVESGNTRLPPPKVYSVAPGLLNTALE
ncbi:hypothetical protein R1sor_015097 [Riccia sorocarpa]|uniref:Uncharacterized protein n=1 Tax=Riccia sorocarpa TaxID=122646 RepID=A0ABD3HBA2_9MARC